MTNETEPRPHRGLKPWAIALICLAVLCAAAVFALLLGPGGKARRTYDEACGLLAAGDPAAAAELFAATDYSDSAEKLNECGYLQAVELLENRDLEAAKAAFLSLDDYKDSARQCLVCDYMLAQGAMDSGDDIQAAALFGALGDYEDSALLADECRERAYAQAKQQMIRCEFSKAAETLEQLGEYKDSPKQLENCLERIEAEKSFKGNSIVGQQLIASFDYGHLYYHQLGYVFVPNEPDENTTWLVYYPGGCGAGENLNVPCIFMEHDKFEPNAVMIYLFNNGWYDTRGFNLEVADLMKQLALECGIWFHDVVTVGSSNGCYPAMVASPVLYEQAGITVNTVIDFDPGCEWDVDDFALLTPEECDIAALAGTRMYLMEQRSFSSYVMSVAPVAEMVEHGVDVVVIECDNDGHNHIGPDAIRAGFYDWAMGQLDGLEPIGVTKKPYVIRMIKVYPDGSLENLKVPYLDMPTEKEK